MLKGIGPALALGIVEHREASGPYLRLEDLLLVSGIGPTTLEGFRNQATVR
ncbi:MAG: competence protein ComEA [Chloroflexi bacterium]|jgi:competence protein ComEA|nr:MAG: competence protein ComEA [Chloroflexota bacterium]